MSLTDQAKHSPLPWHIVSDEFDGDRWLWIEAADGEAVCGFKDADHGVGDTENANAAYVVQTVNAYPHLIDLARLVAADYPDSADWKDARIGLRTLAYSALAAADVSLDDEDSNEPD